MSLLRFIVKEILYRKVHFGLSLLAVVTAVAFLVAFYTTGNASKLETSRLMRDIGYNLRIVANDTDLNAFYARGYSDKLMPQDYTKTLANQKCLLYTHLLATLYHTTVWQGRKAIVTGIAPEVMPVGTSKPSMIFTIPEGTVYVGHELTKSLNIKRGDTVEILGTKLTVKECLAEQGSEDDIRIFASLTDVQKMISAEGLINEIQALNCYCLIPGIDPVDLLREQLADVLPNTLVIQKRAIANARTKQREMIENYFAMVMPIVVIVCAIWIGTLAMVNTRERRQEIGILRALGYRADAVLVVFLGKAVVVGMIGSVIGFAIGTWLAVTFGPDVFKVTAKKVVPIYSTLVWSLIGAPLFAAVSSMIPAALASAQDPADVLRED